MKGHIGSHRLSAALKLSGAALLLALVPMVPEVNAAEPPKFCHGHYVRDLAKPLKELPKVHRLPRTGVLPFGPPEVEMLPVGLNRVVVGGGQVGVYLSSGRPVRLGWTIAAELSRINRNGQPRGPTRHRHWDVGSVDSGSAVRRFAFRVGSAPSIYRFDMSIKSASGALFGDYGEYFRVVRKTVSVNLALSSTSYRPGATLLARLENRGTASIYYGYEFMVERWTGTEWLPDSSPPDGWPLVGLGLGGGIIGTCERVALESGPGIYRLTKQYSTSPAGRPRRVQAKFRIEES
jgi:hypothetical protein